MNFPNQTDVLERKRNIYLVETYFFKFLVAKLVPLRACNTL